MSEPEVSPEPTCPHCGHEEDEHHPESWYDEEGVDGMTCDCGCALMTHSWTDVVKGNEFPMDECKLNCEFCRE